MLRHPLVGAHAAAQDEERRLDDAERVAQVVADGADQLAEGGEPLHPRRLRLQVLPEGVQHDGELEVEDAPHRPPRQGELGWQVRVAVVDDLVQPAPHDVHGAEHVVLRQGDADVVAADARAALVVRLVPGPGEQRVHPALERDLEVPDLALVAERAPGALVGLDGLVEDLRDGDEARLRDGVQCSQGPLVDLAPADVALQLLEEGLFHAWGGF